jgi:hypothetical protein
MISQTDREFLRFNAVYFEQARLGFLHGMPPATLIHMEHLYKSHLDKNFVLTTWCSACVVDMMVRLSRWWEGIQQEEENVSLVTMAGLDFLVDAAPVEEPVPEKPSKYKSRRTRKKEA